LALKNALRYFPAETHTVLAPEFLSELNLYNHIYMYRLRPSTYAMRAYPIDYYPSENQHANAIMLMIMNNLDPRVAQFPLELVTYGGNGCVFQNWYCGTPTNHQSNHQSSHQSIQRCINDSPMR